MISPSPCPSRNPLYLKAGFAHLPLHELDGPLHTLYHQQREQGYQIELLVRQAMAPCLQLIPHWGLVSRRILPGDSSSPSRFSLSQAWLGSLSSSL